MLFGKSLFQSVVDRLGAEAEDQETAEEPGFRISGLATSFIPETIDQSTPGAGPQADQRLDAYFSLMADENEQELADIEPPAPPPPQPPAWIDRLSPEDIAADLGLLKEDDRERLQERRRAFARENHPDTVAAEYRDAATMRMKIANRLIDDAISRFSLAQKR